MLVYRTYPYLASAAEDESGHPMYLHHPQGRGRLDNANDYDVWYFGLTPETAVAETFADLNVWRRTMFDFPAVPGSKRTLGVFEIPDNAALLDLDDANTLRDRALRPTQVIARNRPVTQGWALDIYREATTTGERKWDGVRWWSYHRPHWVVIALWNPRHENPIHTFVKNEKLSLRHPAVVSAARSLGKQIVK